MTPATLRTAYDTAARTWGETVERLGYPGAYSALFQAFPPVPGGHVLDAGCGSGAFAAALAGVTGRPDQLTLLDTSGPMLANAMGAMDEPAARAVQADIGTDRIGLASCDTVLCAHVIEHLPDPDSALSWLLSRLKPGGQLFLAVSHPHWCTALLRWKWGHRAFREQDVLAMLRRAGATGTRSFRFPAGPPSRTSRGYVAVRP